MTSLEEVVKEISQNKWHLNQALSWESLAKKQQGIATKWQSLCRGVGEGWMDQVKTTSSLGPLRQEICSVRGWTDRQGPSGKGT